MIGFLRMDVVIVTMTGSLWVCNCNLKLTETSHAPNEPEGHLDSEYDLLNYNLTPVNLKTTSGAFRRILSYSIFNPTPDTKPGIPGTIASLTRHLSTVLYPGCLPHPSHGY